MSPLQNALLVWPLGWLLAGAGMMIADVFSEPRHGPLWVALALGGLGWGLAGGASAPSADRSRRWLLGLAWALIFPACLLLGLRWGTVAESWGLAGFEGLVAAFGIGGAVGGLLTVLAGPSASAVRVVWAGLLWGVLFLLGGWLGTLAAYLLADPIEALIGGLVGEMTGLALGFGAGWALGGLAAGAAASITRLESRHAIPTVGIE